MNSKSDFQDLSRQNLLLKSTMSLIIVVLFLLFFSSFKNTSEDVKHFDEIVVKKLSMIDSTGVTRIQMTTDLATAPFAGENIERNVPPNMAAIIFMNPNGDEIGGLGFGGTKEMSFALNALDYTGIPLEAIGYRRIQTPKNSSAQLIVMDSPRKDSGFDPQKFIKEFKNLDWRNGEIGEQTKKFTDQIVQRINLGVEDHDASLVLNDNKGNPRIVLKVTDDNKAVFQILDKDGKIVQQFPEE